MLDVVVFLLLEVDVDGSRMAFVECVVKIGDVLDCFPMTRSLFVSLLFGIYKYISISVYVIG